jgi:hypothetical protein
LSRSAPLQGLQPNAPCHPPSLILAQPFAGFFNA